MPKTKVVRKVKYKPVLQLPPLSYEEFTALRDNIAVNGVLVPILVDSDGPKRQIIDGNFRIGRLRHRRDSIVKERRLRLYLRERG